MMLCEGDTGMMVNGESEVAEFKNASWRRESGEKRLAVMLRAAGSSKLGSAATDGGGAPLVGSGEPGD